MDDGNLILAIRSGDRELYGILMDRYQGMAYNLCHRMTGDISIAEELAHDAFVEAYVKLDQLRDPEKFGGWVRRIALNLCRMWYRKNTNLHVELSEEMLAAEEVEDDTDIHAHMAFGLSELPTIHRLVLVLYYLEGLPYEGIAAFLDIPIGTVMSRLHRARNALKHSVMEMTGGKEDEELSMNSDENFKRGVQAEIAVLIEMFREQPSAMERLALILKRSPERLSQMIRHTDDEVLLNNLAVAIPRLGKKAMERLLESYFSSNRSEEAHAQALLFNIIKSEPQGMHRLWQIPSTDVYLALDTLIEFKANPRAKAELLMEMKESCEDRCTDVLITNVLLCYPNEAFPILMGRFKETANNEDLYKSPYILYALCRMGTRFCTALASMLENDNEQEISLALAGVEGIAHSLNLSLNSVEEKNYISTEHLLNDIRIGTRLNKWAPLQKEKLSDDIYHMMIALTASLFEYPHADIRNKAVRILGLLRAEDYLEQLKFCVSHAAESTRLAGLIALANIGGDESSGLFIRIAKEGSYEERCAAIEALGRLKIREAKSLLMDMANDLNRQIQNTAIAALGEIGGEDTRIFLQDLLYSKQTHLRKAAAKALYRGAVYPKPLESTKKRLDMIRGENRPFLLNSMDAVIRFALPDIREYGERELTSRIAGVCFDYSATRRDLMEQGLMTRSNGICELTEKGKTVWRVEHFIMDHYLQ